MNFLYESNRIYLENEEKETIAEVVFPSISPFAVDINRTFVDASLRGQGVAGKLLKSAADRLRSEGKKARCTCSYAQQWFEKHSEYSDIYLND